MAATSTLSIIAASLSVGGTILSTIGSFQQSKAAQDQARFQAAVARNNQIIADRRAADELKRGNRAAQLSKLKARQFEARQLASIAAQGVDVTGSGDVNLLADTAQLAELDALTIQSDAQRRASAIRSQSANFGAQSSLFQTQVDNQSPFLSAGTTALSGFGNVASRFFQPKAKKR